MKTKRILCFLLAALTALSVLSGCGGSALPASEPTAPEAAPAAPPTRTLPAVTAETLSARALDDRLPGECLCACVMIDGQTFLAYGQAESAGEDRFTFVELFTGTPLFRFDGQENGEFPRYYRFGGTVDFEPLDPVMEGPVTLLRVDNFGVDGNYFYSGDSPYLHGIATLRDAGDRYFNLIPEEMRLVTLAPDAGIVWGETPYELLNGKDPGSASDQGGDDTAAGLAGRAQDRMAPPSSADLSGNLPPREIAYDAVDLSEEEFRAAYGSLKIGDPEEGLSAGSFFTAGFFVDQKPHVMYGVVQPDREDGYYIFTDLFSGKPMFRYRGFDGSPWTCDKKDQNLPSMRMRRAEIEGLHPYFLNGEPELCYVDLSYEACNFISSLGYHIYPNKDEAEAVRSAKIAFMGDRLPSSSKEVWPTEKAAWSYLNLVPRPLWVTGDDLAAAEAAG